MLSDKTVRARPRVGVAIADPGEDIPAVDLLDRASAALARTTEGRRRSPTLYDPERHAAVTRRLQLETDLCDALRDGSLHVEYQPVVGLPHGNAVGVEALVRWNHPERGPLPPDEFVPLAEETGLIGALGAFVLEHACDQAAAWRAAGRAVHLAVNVSALEVADPEWVPRLRTILQRSGLPPTDLIIELTEGVFVQDPETVGATLEAVRQLGVRVALDDFGTGYASLSYLRSLPFDLLKIDRSFVQRMTPNTVPKVVESIIALGRSLGHKVTAEGIETVEQADQLRALGCDHAQGFFFARPLDPDDAERLLARNPEWGEKSPSPQLPN